MKIRPLHDRIVVKRLAEETTTKGGIVIPDTAKEKPISGEVLAIAVAVRFSMRPRRLPAQARRPRGEIRSQHLQRFSPSRSATGAHKR